jgi:hypothetical protein
LHFGVPGFVNISNFVKQGLALRPFPESTCVQNQTLLSGEEKNLTIYEHQILKIIPGIDFGAQEGKPGLDRPSSDY